MTESYQNVQTRKATANIELELYDRVTSQLHQGQLTALFKGIFKSLDVMIKEDRLVDITNFIYKANELTLKPVKD